MHISTVYTSLLNSLHVSILLVITLATEGKKQKEKGSEPGIGEPVMGSVIIHVVVETLTE